MNRRADDTLEAALRDLGAHLDLGPDAEEQGGELVRSVLDRIDLAPPAPAGDRGHGWFRGRATAGVSGSAVPVGGRRRVRRLVAAAVVVVIVSTGLLVATPTREAIADWLGIGAVRITFSDRSLPVASEPARDRAFEPPDLAAVARSLPFELRVADPALAGPPLGVLVEADDLVEIRYQDFSLVELPSGPGLAALEKIVGPETTVAHQPVGDRPGIWLAGDPHRLAHLDPDGAFVPETVRRAGNVLLWEDGGVTYRIEGLDSLDTALALAQSLH